MERIVCVNIFCQTVLDQYGIVRLRVFKKPGAIPTRISSLNPSDFVSPYKNDLVVGQEGSVWPQRSRHSVWLWARTVQTWSPQSGRDSFRQSLAGKP